MAQNLENIVDVRVLAELEDDRLLAALDPDFDLGIEIEVPGGFFREVVDALVGDACVLALLACHPLLVHQEQAVVCKNDEITKKFVGVLDRFPVDQKICEFFFEFRGIDLAGVSKKSAEQSHGITAAVALAAGRCSGAGEGKNRAAAAAWQELELEGSTGAGLQAGRHARALESVATPLPLIPRKHGRSSGDGDR